MIKRPYPRHPPCAVECRCDGNQVYAQIGPNMMEGVVGFGDDLPSALRDLADELEKEVGEVPISEKVQQEKQLTLVGRYGTIEIK